MAEAARAAASCAGCGTELAPALLACPACRQLVHAEALKRLAADARAAAERGDGAAALAGWRDALTLLPPGTRQHEAVAGEVARWAEAVPATATGDRATPAWAKRLGPVAVVAFGAWKLLGLAKLATVLTLLASFALYWQTWGWKFAAGFLASMWLHELGHVVALRRAGIPASAPMFVPGVGAFIRMHRAPRDAWTNARVGLAGPLAGAAVAFALYGVALVTGAPLARALAHAGAVINLFNLVPIWSLDGARGWSALSRAQRLALTAVVGAAIYATGEGILWLVLIVAAARLLEPRAPKVADHGAFTTFVGLVGALSMLSVWAR